MGAENSVLNSCSEDGNLNRNNESQVILNVYDLTPVNQYTYWFGFGIFHSGIEVHGKEYGFGAHDFPVSGVFEVEPRSCPGFIYRSSIPVGSINMHPTLFRSFIESVASEYHGDTYHLISKNCNHFSDDIAYRLTSKRIPGWVNRLARLGDTYHLISKNCNHFSDDIAYRLTSKRIPGWVNRLARLGSLCSCLLPESLQVTTVKQIPEYHEVVEDGSDSVSTTTPRGSTEIEDTDHEKHLLSPNTGIGEVSFVKERPTSEPKLPSYSPEETSSKELSQ